LLMKVTFAVCRIDDRLHATSPAMMTSQLTVTPNLYKLCRGVVDLNQQRRRRYRRCRQHRPQHLPRRHRTPRHHRIVLCSTLCAQRPPRLTLLEERPLTKEVIVKWYADLFTGVGRLQGSVHLEINPTAKPVQMPPRRLPIPIKDEVKRELDEMCKKGIIEPITRPSPWVSALLVVHNPNG